MVQGFADKNEYSKTKSSGFYLNKYIKSKQNKTQYNKSCAMSPPTCGMYILGGLSEVLNLLNSKRQGTK